MSIIRHFAEMLFEGISAYGAAICAAEKHQVSSRENEIRVAAKRIEKAEIGSTSLTDTGAMARVGQIEISCSDAVVSAPDLLN